MEPPFRMTCQGPRQSGAFAASSGPKAPSLHLMAQASAGGTLPRAIPRRVMNQTARVTGSDRPRSRRLLSSTDTLDRDMARLASMGDSSQPVIPYSRPAATGMPSAL